jgi:hypothetical protein
MASTEELLRDAAMGRTGVDHRFLKLVLDQNDPAGVLRFAAESHGQREAAHQADDAGNRDFKIELDPLLADLFRHYGTRIEPGAELSENDRAILDFYLGMVRRAPDDVDDGVIHALFPFGKHVVDPLLKLHEELGEEQGSDIAFLLATLRARDPRILALLIERLEYDAADGAFCLGLFGDPAARPALEKMLAAIPEDDVELRREISYALEQLDAPEPHYEPEAFDIYAEYPKRTLPPFDVLEEADRLDLLKSDAADVRAGAAHSFFNQELSPAARTALIDVARSDSDAAVRGEAWASLGDAVGDETNEAKKLRDEMIAALDDRSRAVEERGGAAVGLHAVAERDDVRKGLEALYAEGGKGRIRALEAMWRSLHQPYAKYFANHLDVANVENKDPLLLRQALRGAGYFRLTGQIDKIATFFDREEPYDDLREDALFAYALAMPGETSRGRAKGMLRKIDDLAGLSEEETELVEFALDERLRLHGLAPVFEAERAAHLYEEEHDHEGHDHAGHSHNGHVHPHEHAAPSAGAGMPQAKPGRNDPCPCGSGKKYKKCHGA